MMIILSAAFSCNKDDDENFKQGTCKITQIETFEDGTPEETTYTYDAQGRVISIDDDGDLVTYEYDNQNRISKAHPSDNVQEAYSYTANEIVVTIMFWHQFYEAWDTVDIKKCYLNPDGTIKAIAGTFGDSVAYSYDTKKNVVKMDEFDDYELMVSMDVQYSNIKNPLANVPVPDRVLAFDPLMQSPYMISATSGQMEKIPFTAKVTYEKNEYNYPVSSTITFTERKLTETTTNKYTYSSCQ